MNNVCCFIFEKLRNWFGRCNNLLFFYRCFRNESEIIKNLKQKGLVSIQDLLSEYDYYLTIFYLERVSGFIDHHFGSLERNSAV